MRTVTDGTDTLALLERALDQTAAIIAPSPVPPDAPTYQRLAGRFGRDPGWTPPGAPASRRP
jgi:hypothetical protein